MNKKLFKFITPIFSFLICIICIEFILSFFYPVNEFYYTSTPNKKYSFESDPTTLRGTSKTTNLNFNSIGARSDEIPSSNAYQILAFGGSTTECSVLDHRKTWTEHLETFLNKNNDSIPFWVGNFGKSANDTNHHIVQTEKMLKNKKLKNAKTILYLVGFNDLIRAMDIPNRYTNPNPSDIMLSSFMVIPDENLPRYRRTAIWKFLKDTRYKINLKKYNTKKLAKLHKEVRLEGKKNKKDSILPNMTIGLSHYKNNIKNIISTCKSLGKKPVFLTQPVIWRSNITEEAEGLLFSFFQKTENNNLNTKSLSKCMKIFNAALIDVCVESDVQYIDLFNYSEENWFYDDCHFTEKGAYEVAKIIADNIDLK